jgi:SAM-dependent methyltransferase
MKHKHTDYAPAEHWNQRHYHNCQAGQDLDWGNWWTGAFIDPLHQAYVRTVLDLGCGTGNDVLRLAEAGFEVTGLDYSKEAIRQAQAKADLDVNFLVADMACPLPFPNASFDATMSNVAAHMFSDRLTRTIFSEVQRIVRPGGLFLFHLNALEDRPLRAKWSPPVREIEANYVLEENGQTMRFFSKEYLLELLTDWQEVSLELILIPDRDTGEPFKQVWRGIAYL